MPNRKAPRKPSKLSQGKTPEMDNNAKTSGYEQPTVATDRNPHQDKAVDYDANKPSGEPRRRPKVPRAAQGKFVDGDAKKPSAEPQASPEILQKAQNYEQPTATTNMNPRKDKAVDSDAKKSPAERQRWLEILHEAQDFVTKFSMGLIRMLAPLLSTFLVLFFLFNIVRAAFESACKIPFVPYISDSYCQKSC